MSDPIAPLPRQRRWLKVLGLAAASTAIIVVVLYFVLTSAAFLKGVILPRVSSALHATVTVEDASLSPFSSVSLKGLKVVTMDGTPLLQADEVRTGGSLMGMLGGTIKVDEVRVINAAVEITTTPDGKSSLDPLLAGSAAPKNSAAQSSKPPQLDLQNIVLQNASLRYVQSRKDGSRIVSEVANVHVTLDQLRNGQASTLTLAADLKNEAGHAPGAATHDLVQAKLAATLNVSLAGDLMPKEVGVKASVTVGKAQGRYSDLAGLTAALTGALTPTELKELALNFTQAGSALGNIHARGPLNLEKRAGKVRLEISAIGRKVLNVVSAKSGLDFGNTWIDSMNEISLGQNGRMISVTGTLTVQQFAVTQNKTATVPLDLTVGYDVSVDKDAQSALLQTFTLAGMQQARPVLRAALTQPMSLSWGTNASTKAVGDAALELTVSDLNLADWRAFTGDLAPSGTANVKLTVLSHQGGQKLTGKLDARLDDLAATLGSNKLQNAAVELRTDVRLENFKQVTLNSFQFGLALKGQPAVVTTGQGTCSLASGDADLQASLEIMLARVAALAPVPQLDLKDGMVRFTGHITQSVKAANMATNTVQSVVGDLVLTDLSGQFQNFKLNRLGVVVHTDIVKSNALVQFRAMRGQLTQAANAGGAFEVTGSFNLGKNSGQAALKLDGVNEHLLAPALASALGNKKLVSAAITATATARYDLAADSAVKAELQLANLLVSDPEKKLPETPLSARVALDGSLKKQVLDLRELLVALSPTPRAKNELRLSGKVDLTDTNAAKLNLKLAAESLDMTPFYDLFDNPQKKAEEKKPTTDVPSATPQWEPAAMQPPLRDSTVDVNIGKFFLREIAINNWLTTVKIDGGKVAVQPLQLTLNGAPVNASVNLNLGVPGFQYDVAFGAQGIPVEPLANSFSPTYRGQAKGKIIADVKMKGAGITGENLQRNLGGHVRLSLTNAHIEVVGPKIKSVLTPIALLLGVTEVLKSPLDFVNANVLLGGGKINVQGVDVHSAAFLANVSGLIPIEKVLTNSPLDLPVQMSLTRSVAKKFAFAGNQGEEYVVLPHFATVSGTLGNPGAKTDKVVITGLLATSVAGNLGGKAGAILGGVGSILTGGKAAPAEQPASTNAAPARPLPNKANPLDNLLNPFFKKK